MKLIETPAPDLKPAYPQRIPVNRRRLTPRRGPVIDPKYRAFVRTFACVVCSHGALVLYVDSDRNQQSSTECCHVGLRGLGQRCSDIESLPLCAFAHHTRGVWSVHTLGKRFWSHHGLSRGSLLAELQDLYRLSGGVPKCVVR